MELEDDSDIPKINENKIYLRIFSRKTSCNSENSPYKVLQIPQWKYSFKSVEFLFKLIQLIITVVCTGCCSTDGIYKEELIDFLIARDLISTIIFPNVVFGSYIIILCVIIFSYVLGYPMPDILVRVFNIIAVILYLTAMGAYGYLYSVIIELDTKIYKDIETTNVLVLTVIILCFVNSLLHAFDIYWNIRRILDDINVTNNVL